MPETKSHKKNCGTGYGGFKVGNICASGKRGRKATGETFQERELSRVKQRAKTAAAGEAGIPRGPAAKVPAKAIVGGKPAYQMSYKDFLRANVNNPRYLYTSGGVKKLHTYKLFTDWYRANKNAKALGKAVPRENLKEIAAPPPMPQGIPLSRVKEFTGEEPTLEKKLPKQPVSKPTKAMPEKQAKPKVAEKPAKTPPSAAAAKAEEYGLTKASSEDLQKLDKRISGTNDPYYKRWLEFQKFISSPNVEPWQMGLREFSERYKNNFQYIKEHRDSSGYVKDRGLEFDKDEAKKAWEEIRGAARSEGKQIQEGERPAFEAAERRSMGLEEKKTPRAFKLKPKTPHQKLMRDAAERLIKSKTWANHVREVPQSDDPDAAHEAVLRADQQVRAAQQMFDRTKAAKPSSVSSPATRQPAPPVAVGSNPKAQPAIEARQTEFQKAIEYRNKVRSTNDPKIMSAAEDDVRASKILLDMARGRPVSKRDAEWAEYHDEARQVFSRDLRSKIVKQRGRLLDAIWEQKRRAFAIGDQEMLNGVHRYEESFMDIDRKFMAFLN